MPISGSHVPHLFMILICYSAAVDVAAQNRSADCDNEVIFYEDFGRGATNPGPELPPGTTTYCYEDLTGTCPSDQNLTPGSIFCGSYSIMNNPLTGIVSASGLLGAWISISNHTPGDFNGYMLVVNADEEIGEVYRLNNIGIVPGESYQFSAWFANILGQASIDACGGIQVPVNVKFVVEDALTGNVLGSFITGDIFGTGQPLWIQTVFNFTASSPRINIVLVNNGPGGCGNDFVIDDIELRGCIANTTSAFDDIFQMNYCNSLFANILANDLDEEGNSQFLTSIFYDSDGDGIADSQGALDEEFTIGGVSITGAYIRDAAAITSSSDGDLVVIPNAGFTGNIRFEYIVCDDGLPVVCDTALIEITVFGCEELCFIPGVITPNGDGLNDFLFLECAVQFPGLQVMVYNRWGTMVYDSGRGYDNTWYGTYGRNNDPLPEGTYFYVVEFNDPENNRASGHLTILR